VALAADASADTAVDNCIAQIADPFEGNMFDVGFGDLGCGNDGSFRDVTAA
jgi:hypothetical protein